MVRLLTDNNLNGHIVSGLIIRRPTLDLIRVQDVGLASAFDPEILAWAALHDRILVTHDRTTMTRFAYDRVSAGQAMPGVFVIDNLVPIRRVIDDLLLIDDCTPQIEWTDKVEFLPY
jgi:hypothetical protein